MAHRGIKRLLGAAAASAIGLVLALGGESTAFADDPTPAITFDSPTTQTVEFGNDWMFNATATDTLAVNGPWTVTTAFAGGPSGYTPYSYIFEKDSTTQTAVVGGTTLSPGTYTVNLTLVSSLPSEVATTPAPATLTVVRAQLGVAVHITANASNPRNAIVSAQLTGDLIDRSGGEGGIDLSSLSPSGTWKVSIVDASGATVQSFTSDRAGGGWNVAASYSWPDVAAGDYKATATFTPTGSSAANYTIAPSAPLAFTAPGAAAGDSSTASPAPSEASSAAESGPAVPAWMLLAAGVVTLALIALVVIQIVQLARLRVPVEGGAR